MQSKRSKNDPKGSQRAPKVSQKSVIMHPRIALSARVDFGSEKGLFVEPFFNNFPSKSQSKIDAKNDVEKT